MRHLLWKRYGVGDFYTTGQVATTAKWAGLGLDQQRCAVAVFVKPGEAEAVLREMGSLETQEQIRRRLLDLCFKEYREDNFQENTIATLDAMSGGGGFGSGLPDSSGDHSGGGHH